MKVGFDISQLAFGGGVATYTRELSKRLAKSNEVDPIFFYSSLRTPYKGDLPNVKSFKIPPTILEPLFNKFRIIGIENFIGNVDIFHSSDWTQPKTKALKITTYHDLVPLKFPRWSNQKIIEVHKRRLKLVEKEINMVIAVSEATKCDLLEISKIPEEKIKVIYEGVGEEFGIKDKSELESFRKKYNLPDEFVLAIGGIGERRNLKGVKEAAKDYNLVITGETIPWLSDQEMPFLYNSAKILLYPSFYEGFGLPILEAMRCGLPVVTSNISSMPEVGGEAVEYVNPEDINDIKRRLKKVMEDENLREDMIKKGFVQARKFSWEKCANETTEVYTKLYKSKL